MRRSILKDLGYGVWLAAGVWAAGTGCQPGERLAPGSSPVSQATASQATSAATPVLQAMGNHTPRPAGDESTPAAPNEAAAPPAGGGSRPTATPTTHLPRTRAEAAVDNQAHRAILIAARAADEQLLQNVRANGADINARESEYGETPLATAVHDGTPQTVEFLIRHGADVNARTITNGATPLHQALADPVLVKLLLDGGADPNIIELRFGFTPLHAAALDGPLEVVNLLLRHGANPNVAGTNGATPLHLAVRMKALDRIEALLAAGADVNAKTREGNTALKVARNQGPSYNSVIELLCQHGARE